MPCRRCSRTTSLFYILSGDLPAFLPQHYFRETVNGQNMMGIELFLYTAKNTGDFNASCFSCEVPYFSQTKPLTCKLLKLHNRDWGSIDIGSRPSD